MEESGVFGYTSSIKIVLTNFFSGFFVVFYTFFIGFVGFIYYQYNI